MEKGKQRELLKKEKEKYGLTWEKFAFKLGIRHSKLKTFFNNEVLIDDITFNKLELKQEYKRFIIKKLDEDWGQVKGGKNSTGNLKEIKIPKRTEELAELWGILLGDGNIQRTSGYRLSVK